MLLHFVFLVGTLHWLSSHVLLVLHFVDFLVDFFVDFVVDFLVDFLVHDFADAGQLQQLG